MNYVLENSYPFSFSRQFLNLEVIERFQHGIQQLYFFGFKAPYTCFFNASNSLHSQTKKNADRFPCH